MLLPGQNAHLSQPDWCHCTSFSPPPLQQSLSHSLHSFHPPTSVSSQSRLFMFVSLAPALRHWDKHNLFLMFSDLLLLRRANRRSCKRIWGSDTGWRLRAHISITCLPQQIAGIGSCSKWFRRRKKKNQNLSLARTVIVSTATAVPVCSYLPFWKTIIYPNSTKNGGWGVFEQASLWKPFSEFQGLWTHSGRPPCKRQLLGQSEQKLALVQVTHMTFPFTKPEESRLLTGKLRGAIICFWF